MISIDKWVGLVTNASQYAVPPGAAVEQVNLQCLVPGQLTVRPGLATVTFPNAAASGTAIVRAFRYQHGSGEHIVYQDAAGRIYSSRVAASDFSSSIPPGVPTISAVVSGNASLVVSVTPPSGSGGVGVVGYVYQTSTDGGSTWQAAGASASTSYTIAGLVNGTAYRVRVAATNAAGSGSYSASAGPVTPLGPAAAPASVQASIAVWGTATITWGAPADNGGASITGYIVQKSSNNGASWSTVATVGAVGTYSATGLSTSTSYVFRVAAVTSYGTGVYSAASNTVTTDAPTTVPTQPLNLSASPAITSAVLSWSAPASDGGSAIINYGVRWSASTDGPWASIAATGLSATITGLSPGTRYLLDVWAVNANGGGPTTRVTATTLTVATTPSEPTNVFVAATADGFTATWDAPLSTGGSNITAYRVFTATTANGARTKVYDGLARTYTSTGRSPGDEVYVTVSAVNAVGESPLSSTFNVKVGLAPSAPVNFSATPTNSNVALSWQAPANLYGSSVTGYVLSFGLGYGASIGNVTSYTMTPIAGQPYVVGETYTYSIVAVTAVGSGALAFATFTVPS